MTEPMVTWFCSKLLWHAIGFSCIHATLQHSICAVLNLDCFAGQGRMSEWLHGVLGVDPSHLHPSVRFGLEGALLMALAEHRGESLSRVLGADICAGDCAGSGSRGRSVVHVNGLLDGIGSPKEVAAEAARLAGQGYKTLKMKVRLGSCQQP